ncbi:MAG: alkaline phosphatase family protein [Phocaeicola sp.]
MKRPILTSLLTVIALTALQAQQAPAVPKLVVGLTIDQLRVDYMEAFSSLYGDRGFKRLMKEGHVFYHAEYNFTDLDKSSAVAALYSGAPPRLNGIVGDSYMDRATLRVTNCVEDKDFMGVYTLESSSPKRLQVSNLSDELTVATQGVSEVYSIAPTREMAILAAGHASKGAFWINDETGKWSGSTYYGTFPSWVSSYNDREGLDFSIANIVWSPFLPIGSYRYLASESPRAPFKHKFDDDRTNKYRKFKTSPYVNEEVNKLVKTCLNRTNIGKDLVPDLLSLAYYAGNYEGKASSELPVEMQDTYVRLDNSLADLLEIIDQGVGLHNTLFFITSTGYTTPDPLDQATYKIPTGEFHINRCAALLNMYLAAIYGEGRYVDAHHEQEIYLNHKLLEQKQLKLPEVLNCASEFLVQFSGVKEVFSSHRLLLGAWTPEIGKIRNRYHSAYSGDLWIDVLPGWSIVRSHSLDTRVVRNAYSSTPLIFMGWNIEPRIVKTPVQMDAVAPTVAHFMRIRAPNASSSPPLTGLCK